MSKKVKNEKIEKVLKNEKVSKVKKEKTSKKSLKGLIEINDAIEKEVEIIENQDGFNSDCYYDNVENEVVKNEKADAGVDNQENTESVDLIIDNKTADFDFESDVIDNQENDIEIADDIENNIDLDNENELDFENDVDNEIIENQENKPVEKIVKKTQLLYELLSRPIGASINELIEATGWQKHSIRGTLTNLQKDLDFSLIKVEISKPNLNKPTFERIGKARFIKETRYFIKDTEYTFDNFLGINQENQNTLEND